jgi:hypothetical protein
MGFLPNLICSSIFMRWLSFQIWRRWFAPIWFSPWLSPLRVSLELLVPISFFLPLVFPPWRFCRRWLSPVNSPLKLKIHLWILLDLHLVSVRFWLAAAGPKSSPSFSFTMWECWVRESSGAAGFVLLVSRFSLPPVGFISRAFDPWVWSQVSFDPWFSFPAAISILRSSVDRQIYFHREVSGLIQSVTPGPACVRSMSLVFGLLFCRLSLWAALFQSCSWAVGSKALCSLFSLYFLGDLFVTLERYSVKYPWGCEKLCWPDFG